MGSSKIRNLAMLATLALLSSSCAGVTLEAKMANAIQTVMANSAEAFLLKDSSETSVSFSCSGGGELVYSEGSGGGFGSIDLDAETGSATFPLSFNDCAINVCGDSITFASGGSASLVLSALEADQVTTLIGGGALVGDEESFFQIEIIVTDQAVTGFLEGTISFAYRMRVIGSTDGLSEILILDSESGDPVSLPTGSLPASSISVEANRC